MVGDKASSDREEAKEGGGADDAKDDTNVEDKEAKDLDAAEERFGDVTYEERDQHAIISCSTSAGPLTMHFHRSWSPLGYERATALFEKNYYDRSHFFRVVPHFLVQFGIGYTTDAELQRYSQSSFPDDPKRTDLPFLEGMVSFAAGPGADSRTSQLFIAYDKARWLGKSPWETPIGEVIGKTSLDTIHNLFSYGDEPPWGKGPEEEPIRTQGMAYIEENFPKLDKFHTCFVERVKEMPSRDAGGKEEALPLPGGNVNLRTAIGPRVQAKRTNDGAATTKVVGIVNVTNQQPLTKRLIMIGGAAIVIVILGLKRRKRKQQNKIV